MGRLRVGVLAAALVMAALIVAAAIFTAANPSAGRIVMLVVAVLLAAISVGSGRAVLVAQPESVLGPILTLPGLIATIALAGQISQTRNSVHWTGEAYVTAASQGAWVLVYVAVAVPLLYFPRGRLETRADRWLLRIIVVDAALFIALAATAPGRYLT